MSELFTTRLPQGWRRERLDNICDLLNGYAFNSSDFTHSTAEMPLIRIRDLKTNKPTVCFQGAYDRRYVIQAGELLIGMDGEFRCYQWAGADALLNQRVCKLEPHPGKLDRDFLHLAINDYLRAIEESTAFTTVKHISSPQINAIEIALPSFVEQQRIAQALKSKLAAVERAQRASVARLEAARALPATYLREVFESEEVTEWDSIELGDLAKSRSGTTPSRSRPDYYGGQIPWIKTAELNNGDISKAEEYVTELALSETSLSILPAGTILVAMYGQGKTRGKTGRITIEATTNQACFAILPNQHFDSRFLQMWFMHNYRRLREESEFRGGNQPNLNGAILKSQEILLPKLKRQMELVHSFQLKTRLSSSLVRSANDGHSAIAQLLPSLLRQAFSGTL